MKIMKIMKIKKNEVIFITVMILLVIVTINIINLKFTNDFKIYVTDDIYYEKAFVLDIISENLQPSIDYDNWFLGTQELLVKFTNGKQKGEEVIVINSLSPTHNIAIDIGTKIIVKSDRPDGVTPYYSVYNYDRYLGLILIIVIFAILMTLVGKSKGFKSVIGLLTSIYIIVYFLLPAIYRGWSAIVCTLITILLISTISLLLLNGFSEKTYTSIASTMIGITISTIFFFILQDFFDLSGYNLVEAEQLIVISRSTGLKIREVFFSAVLISSLGAVIDTTMSIASSIYEIRFLNPEINRKDLYKSGVSIGQDMIGTMCQTLILAFVGSSIATLLVLISYGTQIDQFINSDFIALEMVQGFSGSLAIIFAVPITAFLSTITHKN